LARTGLIPVAVLLVTLAIESSSIVSVRAEENCLAAPNGRPPQGSHWYYRTDPVKQSKCWHLRTDGEANQTPTAQEKPETGVSAKLAPPATPKTASSEAQQLQPVQAARGPSGKSPTQKSTQDHDPLRRQAGDRSVPSWPDPQSPTGTGNVAWPAPPVPAAATTQRATEEQADQKQELSATADSSDKVNGNDSAGDRQVGGPIETADSDTEVPGGMLLALAIALVIAGILLRWIVTMIFAPRLIVPLSRQVPVPQPGGRHRNLAPSWVDRLDDDVKEALRKLLRTLDRQAA
jgi:hypothetical protein